MPAPIPPPPPQASAQETERAVRLARTLYGVAILFFLAIAATYSPTGFPVDAGRDDSLTWNLWKLERLDVEALRSSGDGRVVWLVGASIMRDAADPERLAEQLPVGVAVFGIDRGASAVAAGFLDRLPVEPGDVVVHNVSGNNMRRDWIGFSGIPHWWLTTLFAPGDFWSLPELSVQERLEGSANYAPRRFWTNHDDVQSGWFVEATPWLGHRSSELRHTAGNLRETRRGFVRWELTEAERQGRFFHADAWDVGPEQVNVWGLERIAASCRARGAELLLVEVPPTDQMVAQLYDDEIEALWAAEREKRGIERLTKVPDDAYADFLHPNPTGRVVLTDELAERISSRL